MSGLLRICTAGSVDDGKSTLIGRMLHDSQSVYEDQVHSVRTASKNRGAGPIDFSLFTDGLKAEREQGITIDVAYRYFATAAPQVHPRRHARPRAVHAQHGDRRVDRRRRDPAGGRDARASGAVAPPRAHRAAARHLGLRPRRQQDGSRGFRPRRVRRHPRRVRGASSAGAAVPRHPAQRAARRQRDHVERRTPWFEGPSLLEYLETVRRDARSDVAAVPVPGAARGQARTTSSAAMRARSPPASSAWATRS